MLKSTNSKCDWAGIVILVILFIGLQVFAVNNVKAEQSQTDILVDLLGGDFFSADDVAEAIEWNMGSKLE